MCGTYNIGQYWKSKARTSTHYKAPGFYAYDYGRYWGDDIDLK